LTERVTRTGVRQRLAQLLSEAPADAQAIEFEDAWWTWGRLQATAAATDSALTAAGIGPAGRVGLVLENRPEHVAVVLAVLATGRCLVPVSPLQPPERMAADVARSEVPVLLASPDVLAREAVREAATGLVLRLTPEGAVEEAGGRAPADAATNP
jgi:acyl-CoA synthetase (AMP-forming)/AMP-acid ligase II